MTARATATRFERSGRTPRSRPFAGLARFAGLAFLAAMAAMAGFTVEAAAAEPPPTRRDALIRMVRQDCGSCHGMQLTGGLGPALTREALADKSLEGLAITIYQGRLGTPMPGWRSMLSEPEAQWIAERLAAGFPQEGTR